MQNNLWNWQESKAETEEQEAPEGVEEDMNFALPLKKKKKKKVDFTMIENEDSEKPSDGTAISTHWLNQRKSWRQRKFVKS